VEDQEILEESLAARDGEMLENLRLCFTGERGMPRSWEELLEADRETIRRFYWRTIEGAGASDRD